MITEEPVVVDELTEVDELVEDESSSLAQEAKVKIIVSEKKKMNLMTTSIFERKA